MASRRSVILHAVSAKASKKLFLIDAMGFVFRAFYAPMGRLNSPSGIPTKVPYLFGNMVRKLLKEAQPEYIAIVFDPPGPTFRDKLFTDYKAERTPMPEELSQQLPLVRRLCETLRLPMIESQGYEADDVIGALAHQAEKRDLDVFIITSDKDLMQLVGGRVLVLRPGQGAGKPDLIVDAAKVEELMGAPPEKVPEIMALMGDSIDNIPGAKGIGEKGARELIRRFGSAEAALAHASEVENKRYREALLNSREQVLLSRQLATIAADAPVQLDLDVFSRREPDVGALRALYAELGFSSLLRELPAAAPASAPAATDYSVLGSPTAVREFLAAQPPDRELAVWLILDAGERETAGFGSRATGFEISPQSGTARFAWCDAEGQMLAALAEFLRDAARPKIVHDPKILELLAGPVAGIRHATLLYSYLLRPTTAQHELSALVLRYLNVTLSGAPGECADQLQRLAPPLRREIENQELVAVYNDVDLPLAPVLAAVEKHGIRVDPVALQAMSASLESEIRSLERRIWDLSGAEFNINSPQKLAEILFDKMNLATAGKRSRARSRSTAADVLAELALVHELPRRVLNIAS